MITDLPSSRVWVKHQCLSEENLQALLELSESLDYVKTGWADQYNQKALGLGLRSWTASLEDHANLDAELFLLFEEYLNMFGIEVSQQEKDNAYLESSIKKYRGQDVGLIDWHQDIIGGQELPRALSMSLILNHDYEGGALLFRNNNGVLKLDNLEANTCVIFPSALEHKVEEITEGCRKSFISWFHCEHNEDIHQLLYGDS